MTAVLARWVLPLGLLSALILVALGLGKFSIAPADLFAAVAAALTGRPGASPTIDTVLWNVRLPRKTTLFKTLLGLLRSHGGTVRIDGADIAGWTRRRIAHAIAYVPQAHVAYFPFRVLDAVVMGRTAHLGVFSTPGRADYVAAEAALASLGILHLAGRSYTEISGGERQLCLVARALAQDARYIVMDEPTASLDFGNQVHVLQRIRGLAEGGLGVLFSSHDPDHAFLYADRAALLHQGSLLRLAPPREAITPETLRALYGIDVAVVDIASPRVTVSIPVREPGAC